MLNFISYRVKKTLIVFVLFSLLLILFSCSYCANEESDNFILYFNAIPDVQIINKYVNISCTVSNESLITTCELFLIHPNGSESIHSLYWSKNGIYVYNKIYNDIGKYSCYISIEKENGIKLISPTREFWITIDKNDIDSDGMPNWWEEQYNLDPRSKYDSHYDPDLDGFSNLLEYKHGTNPLKNSIIQNASYKIRDNLRYIGISVICFLLISLFSIYGKYHSRSHS